MTDHELDLTAHHEAGREMDRHGLDSQPEDTWHHELESVWPQIQTLAHRIRAGEEVTDNEVRELKDAA